jgi:hypothetical protein
VHLEHLDRKELALKTAEHALVWCNAVCARACVMMCCGRQLSALCFAAMRLRCSDASHDWLNLCVCGNVWRVLELIACAQPLRLLKPKFAQRRPPDTLPERVFVGTQVMMRRCGLFIAKT